MAPLPLFKLGALLAKQLSKPIGKILKAKAQQNENVRKYLVLPPANLYHKIDIIMRMRILGLGSPDKVPPLTEKAAIELGGDLLAEFFVFGTAAGLILFEYLRQSKNSAIKANTMEQKVADLEVSQSELIKKLQESQDRIGELSKFVQDQRTKVEDLNAKLVKLDGKRNTKTATQASQTADGRPIGKVMHARTAKVSAAEDVTNSLLYQVATEVANSLRALPFLPKAVDLITMTPASPPTPPPSTTPTTSTATKTGAGASKTAASKTAPSKTSASKAAVTSASQSTTTKQPAKQ